MMNFTHPAWKAISGNNSHLLIAGPCSAETREQVLSTAEGLKAIGGIALFRAGVWKPRTRPNSFEGVGAPALDWLKEVKEKFGFKLTVEVANAKHTELALAAGVDVLWIGARTTVNPFQVQEIAEALTGHAVPVMVKNPVHADVHLWLGAIERLLKVGVNQIMAIHRGFHSSAKGKYRNHPMWEIPMELKTMLPDLPMICDPSHIMGRREGIAEVAQKSLDLGMNGLMIESHCNPSNAWSDARQQLLPQALKQLLQDLVFRNISTSNARFNNDLELLRNLIDAVDTELLDVLKRRCDLIDKIGVYKKEHGVAVFQPERWRKILLSRKEWAREKEVSVPLIEKLCYLLHDDSIERQTGIMNEKKT